jgi:hypothetical protein
VVENLDNSHPDLGDVGEPEAPQTLMSLINNLPQMLLILWHQTIPLNPQVFALAAITEIDDSSKVPSATSPSPIPDVATCNPSMPINTKKGTGGVGAVRDILENTNDIHTPIITMSYHTTSFPTITTLLDSGASDHCFVERQFFKHYREINPP